MTQSKKGFFISFEGIDGCGKTTQLHKVADWLQQKNHEILCTRQPGGTRIGKAIRSILLNPENKELIPQSELLLYMADRLQHLHETILPSRQQGKIVLCDRFHDATISYQGYGRQLDLTGIQSIVDEWITPNNPDFTFLLEISPELSLQRTHKRHVVDDVRTQDRLDLESIDFFQRVADGYVRQAEADPQRYIRIDASGTIEEVFERVVNQMPKSLTGP